MKPLIALIAFLATAVWASAFDGKYLNVVLLKLPAKYLADVAIEDRERLLLELSGYPFEDKRLDYANGWIHFFSDGGDHRTWKGPSSMFWIKLLPREDLSPLVFVHMAKSFADGRAPDMKQTFILARDGAEWKDVTETILPKDVDLTAHFRPRRTTNVIEIAPYKKIKRVDGRGDTYQIGDHELDLIWDGLKFDLKAASSPKLSNDE